MPKADEFWNTDLADIERSFLGDRPVTALPVHLDDRVPASEVMLNRTVDVDAEVERFLKRQGG